MSCVHSQLLQRLNSAGVDGVAAAIRRCIFYPSILAFIFSSGLTGKEELAHISAAVLRHLPNLNASATTSVLASLSKAHYRNFQLFSAIVSHLDHLPSLGLKDARSVIRSFSRVHFTNTAVVSRCAGIVKTNIEQLRPLDACELLHALTRLRHCDQELLELLVSRSVADIPSFDDVALANFATAAAKAGVETATVAVICRELRSRAGKLGPLETVRSLLALARFGPQSDTVPTANTVLKGLNCSRLSLIQMVLALEAVSQLGCEGAERIRAALVAKRDAYPRVPHDVGFDVCAHILRQLATRIDSALALPTGERAPDSRPAGSEADL
ncbi:hypothetical protein BBBOND_0403730 [Babesia bigemina]|uniref:Uncharacterized protein n=1 Tax=Babesia bigemina TaxID=5866 RepID=A0A061DEU4_BABBI|nr:hypothetical protein BBBOND_0403730 [Babesia bigemina]CDR97885.1 hypothetical protein BBBOND_0403730 [Babesia bigemina]|eukprot:XP_012770071.1 hypothetical protein BBBOND_0403730 [Babesia bigemina]